VVDVVEKSISGSCVNALCTGTIETSFADFLHGKPGGLSQVVATVDALSSLKASCIEKQG